MSAGAVEIALLALRHEMRAVIFPLEYPGPHADPAEYGDDRASRVRKAVLGAGRDLVIGLPLDEPVGDELPESRGKDRVRDVHHLPPDLTAAEDLLLVEDADDAGVPLPAEDLKPVLKRAADVSLTFLLVHLLTVPSYCQGLAR